MIREKVKVLLVDDPAVKGYLSLKEQIDKELNTDIIFDIVEWDKYYEKMYQALSNSKCDLIMAAGHLWLRELVEKDVIDTMRIDLSDVVPKIVKELKIKDELYLFPSFCDGHIIVYRSDIIESVIGKKLNNVITPFEYLELSKLLHEKNESIVMKADKSEIFTDALPFLRMHKKDVYNKEGHCQCDNEEIIKGLEEYCTLKRYAIKDTERCGNKEVCEAIRSGKAAMGVTWSGQMAEVMKEGCKNPEKLGFSTFTTSWNTTWSFAVNKRSEKKELVMKILQYLKNPSVDKIISEYSGVPIRKDSYENDKGSHSWYKTELEMLNISNTLPMVSDMGEKNAILYEAIYEAFIGEKKAKEALKEACYRINYM
ncbi:MAG TPA: extracellular solute-binding protein [Candidatus Dorea intestinavium]|nr:extracellular solute-binding protein [Candidatus Dorea intestinavium]